MSTRDAKDREPHRDTPVSPQNTPNDTTNATNTTNNNNIIILSREDFATLRFLSGLTQTQIASILGVVQQTIHHMEKGSIRASMLPYQLNTILKFADSNYADYLLLRAKLTGEKENSSDDNDTNETSECERKRIPAVMEAI